MGNESNLLGYIILIGILLFVASKIRQGYRAGVNPEEYSMHCMQCGADAPPNQNPKGSLLIEIVLWLFLIVPGVIYSIWRRTRVPKTCSVCNSTSVVPKDTPAAIQHRAQLAPKQ